MKRSREEIALDRIFDALEAELIAAPDAEIDEALHVPGVTSEARASLALADIALHRTTAFAQAKDDAPQAGIHFLRDRPTRDRR